MKSFGIFSYHCMGGMGSYPGLPDRVAHHDGRVIYLEFKAPKGRMGKRQLEFQQQCKLDGVEYHVVRSVDDIERIFNMPRLWK
jgi:hypothetical protein